MSKKGKIIFGIVLSLLLLASAASVTMGILFSQKNAEAKEYGERIDGSYQNAYYEIVDNLNDVETKLGKVAVLSRPTLQQAFLYDIWRQCSVVVSCLSRMTAEEETEKIIGFLNKTGDYCYYLSRKAQTDPPTEQELSTLARFKEILGALNDSVFSLQDKMASDKGIDASVLSDMSAMGEIVKNSSDVDYPELIYDGPFSDGLLDRKALFLEDKEEIAEDKAMEKVKLYFPDASDVKKIGENASSIPAYIFSFVSGGTSGTAQITKNGGYLREYSCYERAVDPQYSPEECAQIAQRFLTDSGYTDMECVWVYDSDSIVYLNFAYAENGVVFYPDLIKVEVNADTGRVLGVECQNYIYNHTLRTVDPAPSNVEISSRIEVKSRRECVIPTEWGTEIRCLEISGTYEGETYYVYYDSETGEEIEALVVVDSLLV